MSLKSLLSGMVVVTLMAGLGFAETPKAKAKKKPMQPKAQEQTLKEGMYTAKVKAVVCGGCGEYIQKAMSEVPGIESSSVDQETSMVHFTVKKGRSVKVADLQAKLKSWADQMGMGANYELSDLKPMKKMSRMAPAGQDSCADGGQCS
jgi:copper chaperone CopZ